MKKLLLLLALACFGTAPTLAQTYSIGNPVSDTNPQPVKALCWNGSAFAACNTTGGTGASADQVQGNSAPAATDSGNPVKVGGVYNSTLPTYTAGQRTDAQADSRGNLRVTLMRPDNTTNISSTSALADGSSNSVVSYAINGYGMNYNGSTWDRQRGDANGLVVQPALSSTFWSYAPPAGGLSNTTTALTMKAAAGASVRNYISAFQCAHDTLGGVTELVIRDGAAGTVLWRGRLGATNNENMNVLFDPPLKGTANTLVEWAMTSAVTGVVYCNAQGYTGF